LLVYTERYIIVEIRHCNPIFVLIIICGSLVYSHCIKMLSEH
jgi:hypothetical protein